MYLPFPVTAVVKQLFEMDSLSLKYFPFLLWEPAAFPLTAERRRRAISQSAIQRGGFSDPDYERSRG